MKKYVVLLLLIAYGAYGSDQPSSGLSCLQALSNWYSWNRVSVVLTTGVGLYALKNALTDEQSSYLSLSVAGLSAFSVGNVLYAHMKQSPQLSVQEDSSHKTVLALYKTLRQEIAMSNSVGVSALLTQLNAYSTHDEKREALEMLVSQAETVLADKEASLHPYNSWQDIVALGVGLMMVYSGITSEWRSPFSELNPLLDDDRRGRNFYRMLGTVSLGSYICYKGATSSSQKGNLEEACTVKQLIYDELALC